MFVSELSGMEFDEGFLQTEGFTKLMKTKKPL